MFGFVFLVTAIAAKGGRAEKNLRAKRCDILGRAGGRNQDLRFRSETLEHKVITDLPWLLSFADPLCLAARFGSSGTFRLLTQII